MFDAHARQRWHGLAGRLLPVADTWRALFRCQGMGRGLQVQVREGRSGTERSMFLGEGESGRLAGFCELCYLFLLGEA